MIHFPPEGTDVLQLRFQCNFEQSPRSYLHVIAFDKDTAISYLLNVNKQITYRHLAHKKSK